MVMLFVVGVGYEDVAVRLVDCDVERMLEGAIRLLVEPSIAVFVSGHLSTEDFKGAPR